MPGTGGRSTRCGHRCHAVKRETLVHRRSLVEWGRLQPESVVLSGDLTVACEADGFRDAYPDRFISLGLMEQNMMSFAAGLAREGFSPLVHTFGVFMYRRALDQVEMSIACADLPVRMFGFLPGVTTPGGPSHQATNDIAVLRSLANMSVVEVGDASDIEGLYALSREVGGPLCIRMLRGEVPRIFPRGSRLELDRARVLSRGDDIALMTTGVCTEEALRVTGLVRDAGIGITHLHVTTLKPFSDPQVVEAMESARYGVIAIAVRGTCPHGNASIVRLVSRSTLPEPATSSDRCGSPARSRRPRARCR